ncbi:unnamed protein product [Spirodela intermedia]|uniref:Uncharacterized protein n=1 Tax=Spirodela intermedia TaxID=51605 RepID=A0A7I8JTH4_SPIIN|nr:unnamed protein product [Spirodela intermedia]CAA6673075.1 unnamed protein product [Spirodela intermedia]
MVAAGVRETPGPSPPSSPRRGCSSERQSSSTAGSSSSAPAATPSWAPLWWPLHEHEPAPAGARPAGTGGAAEKTTAACNSVLRGLFPAERQLSFFSEMISRGVSFNGVSFSYLLHGCSDGGTCRRGSSSTASHQAGARRRRPLRLERAGGSLRRLRAREDAATAAAAIAAGEVISWNSIVAVNAAGNRIAEALKLFRSMIAAGKRPSCALIHGVGLKLGFHSGSVFLRSALIDAYGNAAGEKTLETCNSLVTTLVHCGAIDDALEVFAIMTEEGVIPDEVTLSATLRAASSSSSSSSSPFGSLVSVGELHCWAVKLGLAGDAAVGVLSDQRLLESGRRGRPRLGGPSETRGAESDLLHTAAIAAFGRQGLGKEAVALMEMMIHRERRRNSTGWPSSARSPLRPRRNGGGGAAPVPVHGGGARVELDLRHYCCMASLLGRAGLVREAAELVERARRGLAAIPPLERGPAELRRPRGGGEPRSPAASCRSPASTPPSLTRDLGGGEGDDSPPELRREMGRSTVEVTEARFRTVDRSQRPLTP